MKKENYQKPEIEIYRYFGTVVANKDGGSGTGGDVSTTCLEAGFDKD